MHRHQPHRRVLRRAPVPAGVARQRLRPAHLHVVDRGEGMSGDAAYCASKAGMLGLSARSPRSTGARASPATRCSLELLRNRHDARRSCRPEQPRVLEAALPGRAHRRGVGSRQPRAVPRVRRRRASSTARRSASPADWTGRHEMAIGHRKDRRLSLHALARHADVCARRAASTPPTSCGRFFCDERIGHRAVRRRRHDGRQRRACRMLTDADRATIRLLIVAHRDRRRIRRSRSARGCIAISVSIRTAATSRSSTRVTAPPPGCRWRSAGSRRGWSPARRRS